MSKITDAADWSEVQSMSEADLTRRIELERADAARAALEEAAKRIERQPGGDTYQKAYKAAAALLRRLKAAL